MGSKGRVRVAGSNATILQLEERRQRSAGYALDALAIPAQALIDVRDEIVPATPRGEATIADPHSIDASPSGGCAESSRMALGFTREHAAMVAPGSFQAVLAEGLDSYDGVFTPGGHPPRVNLRQDAHLGKILRHPSDRMIAARFVAALDRRLPS